MDIPADLIKLRDGQ